MGLLTLFLKPPEYGTLNKVGVDKMIDVMNDERPSPPTFDELVQMTEDERDQWIKFEIEWMNAIRERVESHLSESKYSNIGP